MPRGDGTGPMGMGPMTGRAAGYCAGYPVPGFMNPYGGRVGFGRGFGRGLGWGLGMGRGGWGRRNMFYATGLTGWQRAATGYVPPAYGAAPPYVPPYAPPTKDQELEALKAQAEGFQQALDDIRKRMQELEAE